ncbi:LacI family transcriptional regulator [Aureimonas endophytica]|uniref:LacI family transcriptional regulator n=1 Tax=Aureimonas endophytica TaxID=2027858 RepID=A0A916ZG35_9HYPH|nr:LacI family DNA-binding transcriptional regulator [Aureimonas endophytica]GGD95487.1 LacI family transcriptional regulator [Aureimonas endophytica]
MVAKPQTPSIRMVAERAGVSVATVSNVLNGKTSVSPDFAERVTRAVRELGYVVDIGASRLRSGKAALVGVVVPDLANSMFASFVSTLEHAARQGGFDIVVVSARNDPAEEADRLSNIRSWRPAGLIVIPCDGALAERLPEGHAIPTVVADRIPDIAGFDLVAVDNGPAAGKIARHLGETGARTGLVVGTSLSISNVRERWEGVLAAGGSCAFEMLEVGFDAPDHLAPLAERLVGAARPDALFALDHTTSLALYRLVGELGLRIPQDIAYASFDEMEWMRLVAPPLTAVRQPVEAMAEEAWTLLSKRMAGDHGASITRRLTCAVEMRGSTGPREASRRSEAA